MLKNLSQFIPSLRWILLLVVLVVLFALPRIPAGWAAYLMTQGNTLGLSGVTGTVWDGRARMASIEIDRRDYSLGELTWSLSPLSLLSLRPCADVEASLENQHIEGKVCAGLDGTVKVTGASIDAPAELAQTPVPVDGRVSANIQSLAMTNGQLRDLKGNLSWSGARVQAEGRWVTLGSYAAEARYDAEQNALVADVFDLDGPIDLEAETRLPLRGGIFVKGQLELTEAFSEEIQAPEWLPMVLDHQQGNRYGIDLQF